MLELLKENLGNVTKAADCFGISRRTHYLWCQHDPEYKKEADEIQEIVLDKCEQKLRDHIFDKDSVVALLYFLKTKGKVRGYGSDMHVEYNVDESKLRKVIEKAKITDKDF